MSKIKDLFGKKSNKVIASTSLEEMGSEVESSRLIQAEIDDSVRFIPKIDYADPKNFAKFGSAETYYTDSIKLIWKTYPYDGSLYEKTNWQNSSSDVVNYIFENEYPRRNGFAYLGKNYGTTSTASLDYADTSRQEYIYFKGGPNTYLTSSNKKELFDKSNKLKTIISRGSNLELNGINGSTVEFFLNKNDSLGSNKQVIFDLWNNSAVGNSDYGRLKIEIRPGLSGQTNKFYVEVSSGSSGVIDAQIGTNLNIVGDFWKFYSFAIQNSGSALKIQLFEGTDGVVNLNQEIITGSSIGAVSGSMLAHLGSLVTNAPGSSALKGWGKLSGSIDEFRYWKSKRIDRDIFRNWFTPVGGGTNTDSSNTELGVYYKFNEGIYNTTDVSQYDINVLDYSGRVSNGTWIGYSVGSRNEDSAIVLSDASTTEFMDPIVYPTHPDVVSLTSRLVSSGTVYDTTNNALIYNSYPEWIVDEDATTSGGLKELTQIIAEYFDNLYLKTEALPMLREMVYKDSKPLPFAKKVLESIGFNAPDIFVNSSILENFLSRNETENFSEKLFNIKNAIYENIYNNIVYIYKTKGTEKSLRNLIRCFGIDDHLLRINLYADGTEFTFDDRFSYTTEKKKYINFNNVDRFDSTVYQMTQSGDSNTKAFIPGTDLHYFGCTFEGEAIFPKKFIRGEEFFFSTDFVSSSLFGMHEASSDPTILSWIVPDRADLQIYAVRPEEESKNARFYLTSSLGSITTPLYYDVYNDQKWNFAVKLRHEKYPYSDSVIGSAIGNYILDFVGFNTVQDIVQERFILSSTVDQTTAENFISANKRIYAGAHRVNFTGSVNVGQGVNNEQFSDAKISSIRFWHSILSNDIVELHSKDVFNFGPERAYSNVESFLQSSLSGNFIPQIETLALHWDFENVTGSDNGNGLPPTNSTDAKFVVLDVSSGSLNDLNRHILAPITKYHYTGRGDYFPRNDSSVVSREHVYSAKRKLPETINNDDLVNILNEDDTLFTRESVPVNYYFSLEKSVYQNVSDEMAKWLGTIKEFNNLVGKPKYRYESEYKELTKLRQLFFNNIDNTIDFEKFVDFYKWIDDSIAKIVQQLIPASLNVSDELSNVVESHIFERNKYRHKLPTLEYYGEPPIGAAKTINELKYNWRTGHAPYPLVNNQDENCLWWLKRAERLAALNSDRSGIFTAVTQVLNRSFTTVYDFSVSPIVMSKPKARTLEVVKQRVGFALNSNSFVDITVGTSGSFNVEKVDCDDT